MPWRQGGGEQRGQAGVDMLSGARASWRIRSRPVGTQLPGGLLALYGVVYIYVFIDTCVRTFSACACVTE